MDKYQRLHDELAAQPPAVHIPLLPQGVTVTKIEHGYASMYAPDDTPAARVYLNVHGQTKTVTLYQDDPDTVIVGDGNEFGSLNMMSAEDFWDSLY